MSEAETLMGCGGCGLFLHHTPECRWHNGWRAVYSRYGATDEWLADSLEDALDYLRTGEEYGDHTSVAIIDPDGLTVRSRAAEGYDFP